MKKDQSKLEVVKQMLESAENSINSAKEILAEVMGISSKVKIEEKAAKLKAKGRVIEGIFDGENMVGPDKKRYPVPANYASKSKLVVGDLLKLTILEDGTLIFKQIGPVERKKIVGTLTLEGNRYKVLANGRAYKVLLASVTYFKAQPGDQVTVVVPKSGEADWAAIEAVLGEIGEGSFKGKKSKKKIADK